MGGRGRVLGNLSLHVFSCTHNAYLWGASPRMSMILEEDKYLFPLVILALSETQER